MADDDLLNDGVLDIPDEDEEDEEGEEEDELELPIEDEEEVPELGDLDPKNLKKSGFVVEGADDEDEDEEDLDGDPG